MFAVGKASFVPLPSPHPQEEPERRPSAPQRLAEGVPPRHGSRWVEEMGRRGGLWKQATCQSLICLKLPLFVWMDDQRQLGGLPAVEAATGLGRKPCWPLLFVSFWLIALISFV